jgi:hypothetical protein
MIITKGVAKAKEINIHESDNNDHEVKQYAWTNDIDAPVVSYVATILHNP